MAWGLVRQKGGVNGEATAPTITFDSGGAPAAGNILILTGLFGEGIASVSGGGASWSQVVVEGNNLYQFIWVGYSLSGSGGTTITVTQNGFGAYSMNLAEWSGGHPTAPIDLTGTASGSSTTPATPSLTPSQADSLFIAAYNTLTGAQSAGPTNGFTGLTSGGGAGWRSQGAYFIQSGAAAGKSTSWTIASDAWDAVIATFKPASGGETEAVSVQGSTTPTGTVRKQAGKRASGSVAPSGIVTRRLSRQYAGATTPTGALTPTKIVGGPPPAAGWAILVGGVDRSALVERNGLRISNKAYRSTGTLDATLLDLDGAATCNPEDIVRFQHLGVDVFAGPLRRRTRQPIDGTPAGVRYVVTAQDYTTLLGDDVIKSGGFRDVVETDKARMTWVLQTFGTHGITAGAECQATISDLEPMDFTGQTIAGAFAMITKLSGADIYVDQNRRFHNFLTEAAAAPFNISDAPNYTTTYPYSGLSIPDETTGYYTRVFVMGDAGITAFMVAGVEPYGPRETVIRDTNLKSVEECEAAGAAFLADHAVPKTVGQVTVERPGIFAGMTFQITSAHLGMVAQTVYATEVTINLLDAGGGEYEVRYLISFGSNPQTLGDIVSGTYQVASKAALDAQRAVAATFDLSAGGANLVPNSSFENPSTGTWTVGAQWAFGLDPVSPEEPFSGGKVARLALTAQTAGDLETTGYIGVDRFDDYWVSWWHYIRTRTSGTLRLYLKEYDSNSNLLATRTVDLDAVDTAWARSHIKMGPNSELGRTPWNVDTVKVKVGISTAGAAATFLADVDGIQFERGGIITAYAAAPLELLDGSIGSTQIADDSITTPKLAANAVVAGKIAAAEIAAYHIGAGVITADKLAVGAPGGNRLIDNPDFELGTVGVDGDVFGWVVERQGSGDARIISTVASPGVVTPTHYARVRTIGSPQVAPAGSRTVTPSTYNRSRTIGQPDVSSSGGGGGATLTLTSSATGAQFKAALVNMNYDIVELGAGTYNLGTMYDCGIDRTARPLIVRPQAGAAVIFDGEGYGGCLYFGWYSAIAAAYYTFEGLNGGSSWQIQHYDGYDTGVVTVMNRSHHLTFSHIIQRYNYGTAALSHNWYLSSTDPHHITIRYCTSYGGPNGTNGLTGFHIYHEPAIDTVLIDHCTAIDCYIGVLAWSTTTNLDIWDCTFTDCGVSVDIRGPSGTIKRCTATGTGQPTIQSPMVQGTGADANDWS